VGLFARRGVRGIQVFQIADPQVSENAEWHRVTSEWEDDDRYGYQDRSPIRVTRCHRAGSPTGSAIGNSKDF